ncbi:MAG: hypothetical protein QXN95_01740 [Candidatus Bathyarchaeia archaeon]
MSCDEESGKALKIAWFILTVYPLVMAGALIDTGVRFINYVECMGPFEETGINCPIALNSSQTFTFHLCIYEVPPYIGTLHFKENNTYCVLNRFSPKTLTEWEIIRFGLLFKTNETINMWFTSYDPKGNIVNDYNFSLDPGIYWGPPPYEISQPGAYTFKIKNCNTEDKYVTVDILIEEFVFKKPYFYYGILAITIAVLYPTLLLVFVLMRFKMSKNLCK